MTLEARVVLCAALIGSLSIVPLESAEPAGLIPFEIEDQFGRVHTDGELRDRVVVVFGTDRKGSRYNDRWVEAVEGLVGRAGLGTGISLVEVADLRGVPFFVRGSVRKKFPREPQNAVLMDWKGRFAKSYGFTAGTCNILLFDRRGNLVHRLAVQDLDPAKLGVLRENLEGHATRAPGRRR